MKQKNTYRFLIAACFCMLSFLAGRQEAHAQQIAVKTDALKWALLTPNVGCEVVVGEHSSMDFSVFGNSVDFTSEKSRRGGMASKLLAFQPEYRYWFNGRPMIREYIGVAAMVASYDMNIRHYVYKGNAVSLGLTGGYSFYLSPNWRFELSAGFGFLYFAQKQCYETDEYYVDPDMRYNSYGYKLFPAKLGVSFTYIIK